MTPAFTRAIERSDRAARILRRAQDERSWCHAGFAYCAFLAVITLCGAATPAIAQDAWTRPPHVRPEPAVRALVAEAAQRSQEMATLGHELFHATEIASEPSVVDVGTMAAYYSRIGMQTGDGDGKQTFETEAAADAGRRARRELLTTPKRNANGT
jgi:hypothetical protein